MAGNGRIPKLKGISITFSVQVDKFMENGVLMDDGMRCVTKGAIGVSELIKITEEEKIEMENNYDPIEAPPGPYKVQPDIQGLTAALLLQ